MIRIGLFLISIAASVSGCGSTYSGDGSFIDKGFFAGPRYELDLGPVDLTRTNTYIYRLVGLPDTEFVAGFEIIEAKPNNADERPSNPAIIRFVLENSNQAAVVSEDGPLDSWVWSYGRDQPLSFLYRRGKEIEIPVGTGTYQLERVGVRADGGWGTYFTPTKGTIYTLTLSIVQPQQPPQRPTRLLLTSLEDYSL